MYFLLHIQTKETLVNCHTHTHTHHGFNCMLCVGVFSQTDDLTREIRKSVIKSVQNE